MKLPDIDDAERWVVESALRERYGKRVQPQLADVELKLAPGDAHLTACPTLCWEERGAAFVIAKISDGRYRTMFLNSSHVAGEQYGTGRPEFDDFAKRVTTVLRLQADHDKECVGVPAENTAGDLRMPGEER